MRSGVLATTPRKAWFHVDLDGLDAIYRGHGQSFSGQRDEFYQSGIENALSFFDEEKISATFFLIARDLENPAKRSAVENIVRAGHHIACHSLNHLYLNRLSSQEKWREIADAKKKIEDTLGVACLGFRAPGYSIDFESLDYLCEAGYRYDSSIFPGYAFKKRLGTNRLFDEPFMFFPERGFAEIPLPYLGPLLPPFHPCYSFYLSRFYFSRSLDAFKKRSRYLTCLFHLTDFAQRQRLEGGLRIQLFANNLFSAESKRAFLSKLVSKIREDFAFTTTESFLEGWPESAPELNPRTILGISTTHETGACVVRDGQVLAAISEERLTRKKFDTAYPPVKSIREVIRISGIAPEEIDAVAIGGLHWRDLISRTWENLWEDIKDFHSWNDYFPHFCRVLYRAFYFWRALGYGKVIRFLEKEYGISPREYYVEHHEAHASSAYRTGQASSTLIVTADGVGDDVAVTFSTGKGSVIRRLQAFNYPHSFGQFYTACTQILGFKAGHHEGKITGLSGYGRPDKELISAVEKTLFVDNGFRLNKRYYSEGFMRPRRSSLRALLNRRFHLHSLEYRNFKKPLKRLLAGYPREDVAHAFQFLLERELVRLTQEHVKGRPLHLALAGGVFANVKLNMALSEKLLPESLFVFPNMGDGGLCVGAALSVGGTAPNPIPNMYLGTEYSEDEILETLQDGSALPYSRPSDMADAIANELLRGKIVARFDGRMEFGPRALGNRSVLYHCGDKTVNDWLNRQLNRTEFMPFAPICIYEDAEEYFVLREGEKRPCEFMTLVVRCTDRMIKTCPAAVHVDETARPQLLKRETNPAVYDILIAYRQLTGISCLINTSFNMHEEPIVRSPREALAAFQKSKLDLLVLGPYLVSQPEAEGLPVDLAAALTVGLRAKEASVVV